MPQEQFNLNWHTYSDHLKEMMLNLMDSNETADVTLVCEDKAKFRAHKFVLMSCSPVFHSIINDLPKIGDSVIYLRGVLAQEMKSILQFMYLGQATFYHYSMNEFLNVAKTLKIKGISKDVESDETEDSKDHVTNDNVLHRKDNSFQLENNKRNVANIEEMEDTETKSTKGYINESGTFQCNQCNKQFSYRKGLRRHIKSFHEGLCYMCGECNKNFSQKESLNAHIKGVHEGIKFPCDECPYKATTSSSLFRHKKRQH